MSTDSVTISARVLLTIAFSSALRHAAFAALGTAC
jgi:hypothetical protein